MSPLPSAAQAAATLGPRLRDLCDPVYAGWRRWQDFGKRAPDLRADFTPRARANAVHDWTVAYAKATLSDREAEGFTLTEQPGFLVVTVDDQLAVRYKKFDDELGTCGIRTNQRQLWTAQVPLDGMHELTHLVAGYQLDEFERLDSVAVTCSVGARVFWHLDAPASGLAQVVQVEQPAAQPGTVVRPAAADTKTTDGAQG